MLGNEPAKNTRSHRRLQAQASRKVNDVISDIGRDPDDADDAVTDDLNTQSTKRVHRGEQTTAFASKAYLRNTPHDGNSHEHHKRSDDRLTKRRKSERSRKVAKSEKRTLSIKESVTTSTRKQLLWPPDLPYHVLFQIFQEASHPLVNKFKYGETSVSWLLRIARLCRNFMEPALAVLYYCPPLLPASRAHGLLAHLKVQNTNSMINYRAKIRFLELEAVRLLSLKYAGQESINLPDLIKLCPQLKGLSVDLNTDVPGSHAITMRVSRVSPVYDFALFEQLDATGVNLHHFKWNYQVSKGADMPWSNLCAIHSRTSFRNITHLEIARFDDLIGGTKTRRKAMSCELASSLDFLKNLKAITFTKCRFDYIERSLGSRSTLHILRIIDCHELDSTVLEGVLDGAGRNLRELTLKHNRALNLAFTENLAKNCPLLETFEMDFQCFDVVLNSSELLFEAILPDAVVPTWPSTLREIELLYLRKWDFEHADLFFNSLWTAASRLPDLRTLVIRSSLEKGYKDRMAFRNLWLERIKTAFQRESSSPGHHFTYKEKLDELPSAGRTRARRSRHSDSQKNSDTKPTTWEGLVPNQSSSQLRVEGATRTTPSTNVQSGNALQPLCNVVDIHIDNLRPMQTMYSENDFVDSEPSDDEEWTGDKGGGADYAW